MVCFPLRAKSEILDLARTQDDASDGRSATTWAITSAGEHNPTEMQKTMTQVGFEPTIPELERVKILTCTLHQIWLNTHVKEGEIDKIYNMQGGQLECTQCLGEKE